MEAVKIRDVLAQRISLQKDSAKKENVFGRMSQASSHEATESYLDHSFVQKLNQKPRVIDQSGNTETKWHYRVSKRPEGDIELEEHEVKTTKKHREWYFDMKSI